MFLGSKLLLLSSDDPRLVLKLSFPLLGHDGIIVLQPEDILPEPEV